MALTIPSLNTDDGTGVRLAVDRRDDGDGDVSDSWVYGLLRRERP